MYFFRREKILCRYQFALQDAVEPALLQRALEAALSAAPYYRVQLVQEKRSFFLEPNPNPCLVYQGSAQRDIPEETNGYLFSVSCEGDTVYFDWYHFLMDGHGVSPFLTRILEQYCNLRYGTAFANTPILCSPAYDIEAMMEKYPDVKAAMTSMDGKIYGLPYVFHTATVQGHTAFFSEEWMKNVGVDKVPETTDELYDMLVAFKEQDANGNGDPSDEIPFTCVGLTTTIRDLLIPAFTGLPDGLSFNLDDEGKVVYAPATEEYKEFLKYANKLYSEGLLDPEFSTQTAQQWQAKVKADQCGIYSGSPTTLDPSTTAQQLSLPPLTSATNDEKVVKQPLYMYPGRAFITDKCSDPVAAIRLLDMFYATEEDAVEGFSGLTTFVGWEGEHWEYTDDTKTAYSWIDPITGFSDINKTVSVNMELPGLLEFNAMPAGSPLMEMKCEQVAEMQAPYYNIKNAYPQNARFTAEESERGNVIENDLYTQVLMMTTKFIVGDTDIESGWEDYLASLEKIGLAELTEIKEAALARWNEAIQ